MALKLLAEHYGIDKEPSEQNKDFLLGVLENKWEYSEEQWSQPEDKIIAALYVRALLRAKGRENKICKVRYKALARKFEDKAVDLLKKLQKDDMEGTKELLLKRCESWGGLDCISLAFMPRCDRFLALKSAHEAVSSVWNGSIKAQPIWFWRLARKLLAKHYAIDKEPSEQNKNFLRGVMENKWEYSEEQWSQQEDKIIAALYTSALLHAKGKDNENSKGRYKALASKFEDKAVDLLKELQKDDMDHAKEFLRKSCESWGGLDCISLAVKMRCGRFLALESAHEAVSSVSYGDIECQAYSIRFWIKLHLALLIPPVLFLLHYKSDEQNSTENENAGFPWNGPQKIYRFYRAPAVAFRLNVIFSMAFIGIYSYMVLVEFGEKIGWSEIVIYIWVFTMVIGEINEIGVDKEIWFAAVKFYVKSAWNLLDILSLSVFFVGAILRPFLFEYHVDIVRSIYAMDLIVFCVRFLQILTVSKLLGPKLVMIKAMVMDLIAFCVIIITIMFGYAVAMEAILYPNARLTLQLPYFLGRKAFFQIFGDMYVDDIEGCSDNATLYEDPNIPRCPSPVGIWIAPVVLGGYIVLTNVLLLNLLIAVFTTTFERIQSEEEQHWNLERARLVLEYDAGPAFPPPLNVLCILSYYLYKKCCKKYTQVTPKANGGPAKSIQGQLACHWSSPVTQLSPVAPRSCRMQKRPPLGHSFGGPAKPGEGSRRV